MTRVPCPAAATLSPLNAGATEARTRDWSRRGQRTAVGLILSVAIACNSTEPLSPPTGPPLPAQDPLLSLIINRSVTVRSLDAMDLDFSDLSRLKVAIGDARIVMLGEQSHADGATFKAKVRLIKFLHQEMGYGMRRDTLCLLQQRTTRRPGWSNALELDIRTDEGICAALTAVPPRRLPV